MSYQELTVDVFLERVEHMPDAEAEMELILRKERGAADVAMLQTEHHDLIGNGHSKKSARVLQIGAAIATVCADNVRINEALKRIRRRMDAANWAKAVTAIFGQEGFERCKVWMIVNNPERAANYEGDLRAFMDKHGLEYREAA
jgi:hypothetical protein